MSAGSGRAASRALGALAVALRVVAAAYVVLLALDLVAPEGLRTWLLGANGFATRLELAPLAGLLVVGTPLGGALRGDYALMATLLLVLAWVARRAASALRRG